MINSQLATMVLITVLGIVASAQLVSAQSAPSYSWNCPETPIYGNSPFANTQRVGGWISVSIAICPQKQYYVYYANDGTYRWVWIQLMRVNSVPNTSNGWKHTTGGIVKDNAVPTQMARHICASWYSLDLNSQYLAYTLSSNCIYGPSIPDSIAPISGEYNVGTVTRTVTFGVSAQGKDQSGSTTFTLNAQWTESIPRIQVSLNVLDARSVEWRQYIYDGGDSSLGSSWGSTSWYWMYGLTVLAKPNSNFYLGVFGRASFWRCQLWCLSVEYDQPFAAWFVKP